MVTVKPGQNVCLQFIEGTEGASLFNSSKLHFKIWSLDFTLCFAINFFLKKTFQLMLFPYPSANQININGLFLKL